MVQDFYSGTKPDCSPCCRPGRVLLQVLTDFTPKSHIRSSVHWISTGPHQDRAYADAILGELSPMRSNLFVLTASSRRPETGLREAPNVVSNELTKVNPLWPHPRTVIALPSPDALLETGLRIQPSREKPEQRPSSLPSSPFSPVRFVCELSRNTGMFRAFYGK